MSGLRGFGFTVGFNPPTAPRYWYAGKDGVQRDALTDEPLHYPDTLPKITPPDPLAEFTAEQLAEAEQTEIRG